MEIIMSGTGKTEQCEVSRLAKCNMFDKFMNLCGNIPSSTLKGICDCPKTYRECKDKAVLYQVIIFLIFPFSIPLYKSIR